MTDFAPYLLANTYSAGSPVLPLIFFSGFSLLFLALVAIVTVASWKLYVKAGQPGWAALIPIYNIIVLLQILKRPLWWIILFFIPVVNIIVNAVLCYDLAKAFGKDVGYAIGLFFLGFIFVPILAFGDAQYVLEKTPANGSNPNPTPTPTPTPPPAPPTTPANPIA